MLINSSLLTIRFEKNLHFRKNENEAALPVFLASLVTPRSPDGLYVITTSLEDENKEFVADEHFITLLDLKFITAVRNCVLNFVSCILPILTLIRSFDLTGGKKSPGVTLLPSSFKNRMKQYVDNTLYRNVYGVELVRLHPTIFHIVSFNLSDRGKRGGYTKSYPVQDILGETKLIARNKVTDVFSIGHPDEC